MLIIFNMHNKMYNDYLNKNKKNKLINKLNTE